MNFDLSEEQRLLSDSLRRFVADRYDPDQRRRGVRDPRGFSQDVWSTFAELGWLGAPLPESVGGYGGGAIELMLTMEALGRGLVVEPFVANVVLGAGLLAHVGGKSAEDLCARMIAGETQLALAFAEPQARFDIEDVATRAVREGDAWVIDGRKSMVLNARAADVLIVVCRTSGADRDQNGLSLFIVEARTAGVSVRPYHNHDGASSGDVHFARVRVGADALLGRLDEAAPALAEAIDRAAIAECAAAVGAMEWLVENTIAYLKTRVQFGKPLASFQVLQHRLVDMFVTLEEMRSLTIAAALALQGGAETERGKAVSAARVHLGSAGRALAEDAIQMHGGIGMTDEFPVGHYYKRILAAGTLFGDHDHHLGRLGALMAAD
ncbi:MAG: acyl-CoA dehydrogenase family protein [Hyphomicrobiales bacterium]|nr:acyl-CoA dehydrogenase family protein [Hyphomicrobiales bacterium]